MTRAQSDAAQIAAFPALLALGVLLIPVVPDYADHAAAGRAAAQAARWLSGHLVSASAFAASVAASAAVQRRLARPRAGVTLLIAIGAGLHAAGLGADGIGPLAVAASGLPAAAFFDGSGALVGGTFVAGAVCFGIGQVVQSVQAGALLASRPTRALAVAAAVAFPAAEAVPSGWGLYAVAVAAATLYLPVAGAVARGAAGAPAPSGG